MKSRLESIYKKEIVSAVKSELKLKNIHLVPRVEKIVINTGVKEAVHDQKALNGVVSSITLIAGQKAVKTKAKKSIASFKVREGMSLGVRVTLRNDKMYNFLDKLINIALPCVRDFRGVKGQFDGNGNFNLGIKDWMIFPEIEFDRVEGSRGLNISIITSAKSDEFAKVLLKRFGIPFA
jgi:large subunit ribosomal protein L5